MVKEAISDEVKYSHEKLYWGKGSKSIFSSKLMLDYFPWYLLIHTNKIVSMILFF